MTSSAPVRALVIVDVQPTFCEGGSLPVDGGNAVAQRVAEYARERAEDYSLVVTTQDWHIEPGNHFSVSPDYVSTWPPHGVAGTPEADLHPALADLVVDASVKKGQYSAAYSGFEGMTDDGRTLVKVLRDASIEAIDVVGLAESHCVKATALDGVELGLSVRVFTDLTAPVSAELGRVAREETARAGVELLRTTGPDQTGR